MRNFFIVVMILQLMLLHGCSSSVVVPVDDRTVTSQTDDRAGESDLPAELPSASTINSASPQSSPPEEQPQEIIDQRLPDNNPSQPSTVVLAMINQAELHMAEGNTQQAIASLERGARLKPKDPWLWHSLAVLRLQMQQWREAITLAEKSIALSSSNRALLAGNWQVIVTASKALGDIKGMQEAERRLREYQPRSVS